MPASDLSWVLRSMRVIYFAGQLSLLLPIYMGYRRRAVLLPPHRFIWWCCVMWAVLTFVAETLRLTGHYNSVVWNIVSVFETLLIGCAFCAVLTAHKIRVFLRIAAAVYLVVAAVDNIYANAVFKTTVYTNALGSALLIFTVLLYFEQTLHSLRVKPLEREPMFVIGVGVLLYFASTTCFFLLEQGLPTMEYRMMMTVNALMCIVFHYLITRAFWLIGPAQAASAARSTPAQRPTACQ